MSRFSLLFALLLPLASSAGIARNRQPLDTEIKHDDPTPIMIASAGYPCETHTVVTDDCYILEMHRIPHGKKDGANKARNRPPVLLVHGLIAASSDWVIAEPDKSLGFILADAGYDVWLGNMRGNTYSKAHCTLDTSDLEFWQFSFDEIGKYDVPAMIDKVREKTSAEKIFYAGHSMGTTTFMIMADARPEYMEYIQLASFLAPVAYVGHMTSPLKYLAPFTDQIEWIVEFLGLGEFLPSNAFMDWIAGMFCDEGNLQGICSNILFILCGFDEAQLNKPLLETILKHVPAGASTKTIIHFGQEIRSKKFAQFDYKENNNEIYGQDTPPDYDLSKVTAPVALYWSDNDLLAHPTDVLMLASRLPNIFANYEVPYEKWNHLDYVYGIDADFYVYDEVLKNMDKSLANY